MYYIDKKIEHLEGVIEHYYQTFNEIDDIPIHLLTEVTECEKAPEGYIDISREMCKNKVKSLITDDIKYISSTGVKKVLSDISLILQKTKEIAYDPLYNMMKSTNVKHNCKWFDSYGDVKIGNVAEDMNLTIFYDRLYLNKSDAMEMVKELELYNKEQAIKKENDRHFWYLKKHTVKLITDTLNTFHISVNTKLTEYVKPEELLNLLIKCKIFKIDMTKIINKDVMVIIEKLNFKLLDENQIKLANEIKKICITTQPKKKKGLMAQ